MRRGIDKEKTITDVIVNTTIVSVYATPYKIVQKHCFVL